MTVYGNYDVIAFRSCIQMFTAQFLSEPTIVRLLEPNTYVKFIATHALTFFWYIITVLASVIKSQILKISI